MREYIIGLGLVISFVSYSVSSASINHRSTWRVECDCSQINRDGDKIFITYERLTSRTSKKKNDIIWLRFHNETNCPIYVPTDHEYSFKNNMGQMTFDIPDGSVVFVKYMVEKVRLRKRGTESRDLHWVSYTSGSTYATRLPAGSSLLFYVPIANLKQGRSLAVAYVCQKSSGFDQSTSRALLNLNKVPALIH